MVAIALTATPSAPAARIVDVQVTQPTHDLYDVYLHDRRIRTLVTHTPQMVDQWIATIQARHEYSTFIIGLDIEWRPNNSKHDENPVATIQLCDGQSCLIFQFLHAPFVPLSLKRFLRIKAITFVGVGIDRDVRKLKECWNLKLRKWTTVDLAWWAARRRGDVELRGAGLRTLARVVIGKEVEKPRSVTMSRWDDDWLNRAQVQYACLDAYLSFEIGKALNATWVTYNNLLGDSP